MLMSKRGSRNVTASEIAAMAGVSQATVSLVLNQRGDAMRINRKTQKRVIDAARQLNYVPNYLARGLKGASTQTIGLLWSLAGTPTSAALAHDMTRRLAHRDYMAYLADTVGEAETTVRILRDLAKRRVDGLVLQGANLLAEQEVIDALHLHPAVVVVTDKTTSLGFDQIVHNRGTAFSQMAEHFAKTGRKRPAVMGQIAYNNLVKVNAYRKTLAAYDIDLPAEMVIEIPWKLPTPLDRTRRQYDCSAVMDALFPGKVPFDAMACMNDDTAMSAIAWLRGRGLRVPDDVAVTGFNNLEAGEYFDPPLASVDRRDGEVADHIERMMFERMADPDLPTRTVEVSMSFVHRRSAGS